MNAKPIVLGLTLLLEPCMALADDDCDDPVNGWQPRENLRQQLETEGWTAFRIKLDDGCYKVRGLAPNGDRVEASYSPASFELMKMEREEDEERQSPARNGRSNGGFE